MAVESKPLFHPEVIRQRVRSFTLPERAPEHEAKLKHWAELIASGGADEIALMWRTAPPRMPIPPPAPKSE